MQTQNIQLLKRYQNYAKRVIHQYFGSQKKEFWDDFPGGSYLCFKQALQKITDKHQSQKNFTNIFKYEILNYFQDYFLKQKRIKSLIVTTPLLEEIGKDDDNYEELLREWDRTKLKTKLKKLEKESYRQYAILALRFGLLDGQEHKPSNDLPQRLFDLGIKTKTGQTLSYSQTYRLLQSSLFQLKTIMSV